MFPRSESLQYKGLLPAVLSFEGDFAPCHQYWASRLEDSASSGTDVVGGGVEEMERDRE